MIRSLTSLPYLLFIKDRFIQLTLIAFFIVLQLAIWPLILKSSTLPKEIPFWYTQPTSQLLAPASNLWWLVIGAMALGLTNLILSLVLYRPFPTVSRLLTYTSCLIAAMAAVTIIKTILIYLPIA